MSLVKPRVLGLCALLGALSLQGAAANVTVAQPAAQPEVAPSVDAQYTDLIRTALAEMNARNYPEARALFLKAHALQPSARTERALGNVEFELRRYTVAASHFRAALSSTVRPLDAEMRKQVEQALERTESYAARVQLELSPAGGTFTVDGRVTTPGQDGSVWLDLGEHELRYEAPGHHAEVKTLSIAGAERLKLELALTPSGVSGPQAAVAGAGPRDESTSVFSQWWFWTAAGVVVAGTVVAVAVATSGDDETEQPIAGNLGETEALLRWQP